MALPICSITHDLAVMRSIADRVIVFETSRLIEAGAADAIFTAPARAYTRCLLGAIPVVTAAAARFPDQLRDDARFGGEIADTTR